MASPERSKSGSGPTIRNRSPGKAAPDKQPALVDPWVDRCAAFAAHEGFRHFFFGLSITRPEGRSVQFALTNYPHEWLRMYDDNHYIRIDPVAARLLTSITPFAWDELHIDGDKEKVFWTDAERFGLQYGYTVPVHGPRGQHATLGVGGIERPLAALAKKQLFERMWSFTVDLLEEIFGTYLQHDGVSTATPLNSKQRDTLSMIAEGRSIRDVGAKLGVHARTIEYHLNSAMRRLGAATREQAIVRALLSGDIEQLTYPGQLRDWCLRIKAG